MPLSKYIITIFDVFIVVFKQYTRLLHNYKEYDAIVQVWISHMFVQAQEMKTIIRSQCDQTSVRGAEALNVMFPSLFLKPLAFYLEECFNTAMIAMMKSE